MSDINKLLQELKIEVSDELKDRLNESFENAVAAAAVEYIVEKNLVPADKKDDPDEDDKEDSEKGDKEDSEKESLKEQLETARGLLAEAREEILNLHESVNSQVSVFLEEKKDLIPTADEYNRMVRCFERVKSVFEENGFKLNENHEAGVESLEEALRESHSVLLESKNRIQELERALIFESRIRNLTDIQAEKAKAIMESLTFNSDEEFETGVSLILERVGAPVINSLETLEENTTNKVHSEKMNSYLKELKRLASAA